MTLLEVVIALAGALATAMVIAAMILLTPFGTESAHVQRADPEGQDATDVPSAGPSPTAIVALRSRPSTVEADGAIT